jgi:hypothetical protein
MPTEKQYKSIEAGEHFHGNNPDMKLDFAKPDKSEIDAMAYHKPVTSIKDIDTSAKPSTEEGYMGVRPELGYVNQTPNVNFVDDAPKAKNSEYNTQSD